LVDARLSANCDSGSSGDAAAEICAEALAAEYNWSAAVEEVRLCRLALKTSLTPHLLARLARHRLWRQFSRRLSDWPCLPGPARAPAEELAGSPPDGLTIRQFDRLVARLLLGLGFLGPAGWRQARQLLVPFCGGEFFPSEFFDKWINPEEIMQPFNCENSIRHEFRSQQSNCGICVLLIDPCDDTNNKNFENEVEEKLRQFGRILITRPAASDSGDGTARFVLQLSNLDDLFHAEQDWSFRVRCRFVLPGAEIFPEPPAGPPTSCRPDCPVRRLPPGAFQDGVLDRLAPSDWLRLSRSCVCFRRLVSWRPRLGLRLRQLDFADSGDSLDDSGERQQEEDELQQFLRCLGSASDLRSLSVTKATPPGLSLALSRIARCLPALTELRLPVCPSPLDCLLAGDSLRCLTVLHLADPDSRLPRGWRRSSRQAVKRFNDQALWLLMRGCGRHLEQLSLPAQQLRKAEAFCFIADCRLRQLTLTNVANETVVTAAAEACGSGLVSLRLTLARQLERLGDRVGWEKLEKLEELRIERELLAVRCSRLDSRGLAILLARCRSLVSLDLTKCPDLARPGQLAAALARRAALSDGFDRFFFRPPGFESVAAAGAAPPPMMKKTPPLTKISPASGPAPPGIRR
uniref:F-box domain-containing protein n=1 Tax=Macrostomum lignano TaxID=282301 RepID=A0A1I8ITN5_9PLAT